MVIRKRTKIHSKFRKSVKPEEPVDLGYTYILRIWETSHPIGWKHFLEVLKVVDFPLYETLVERYRKTYKAVEVCYEFFNKDFRRMMENENWVYYGKQ